MYFWDLNKLKTELKEGPLPELESFKYILAETVLVGLVSVIPASNDETMQYGFLTIFSLFSLVISILGLVYVYNQNQGNLGKNFMQKYFALTWVIGFRFAVMTIVPILVLYIVLFLLIGAKNADIYYYTVFGALLLLYYYLIGKNIKDTI